MKLRYNFQNDEEFENLVRPLFNGINMTGLTTDSLILERKLRNRSKRSLPETFDYWEKEVGLSTPRDQMSCGSCWSFPNVIIVHLPQEI